MQSKKSFRQLAKLILISMFALMLFVGALPAQAQPVHAPNQATVSASFLNMRSGPGVNYGIISTLVKGQALTMIGRNADASWVQATLNGTTLTGWVNKTYIYSTVDLIYLPVTSGETTPTNNTATVSASYLNMRSGAGANTNIVGRLSKGQAVTLIGRDLEGRWLQISTGTLTGWVSGYYLNYSMNVFNLPLTSNTGISDNLPQPIDPNGQTGIVTASFLNVRLGPSVLRPSFTTLRNGAGVSLIGRTANNAWLLIQMADGRTGWVSSSYISTGYPIGSLTVRG